MKDSRKHRPILRQILKPSYYYNINSQKKKYFSSTGKGRLALTTCHSHNFTPQKKKDIIDLKLACALSFNSIAFGQCLNIQFQSLNSVVS